MGLLHTGQTEEFIIQSHFITDCFQKDKERGPKNVLFVIFHSKMSFFFLSSDAQEGGMRKRLWNQICRVRNFLVEPPTRQSLQSAQLSSAARNQILMEIMSGAGKLARVNGAIHEAGQLRISFTQFGKSYPRDAASLTDHPSTTQYGKLPLCTLHQLQDQILEQSKSDFFKWT